MSREYDDIDRIINVMPKEARTLRPMAPLILFALTVITTLISGALQQGLNIIDNPKAILRGYPFAISLIAILGTHEFGHFFASRRHGVFTTLPYFIPGPPIPPMIGTFGAVIKMKSPIMSRSALVDIGAAGPISGFLVSIVVTIWGLKLSQILPLPAEGGHYIFGSSLIFHMLTSIILGKIPHGYDVFLHPIAYAGWIGFFVTTLNLIPIGQLDGGHIMYALFGVWHRIISVVLVAFLAALGALSWSGWFLWAAILIFILGIKHPPVMDDHIPLDVKRKFIAIATIGIFVLTFVPLPISVR